VSRGSGVDLYSDFAYNDEDFLPTEGFFPENEEISTAATPWIIAGIYKFYESRSTETFRKSQEMAGWYTTKTEDWLLKASKILQLKKY